MSHDSSSGFDPGADRRQRLLRESVQRFDFIAEVDKEASHGNIVVMRFRPDPRRYDEVSKDGETLYVDRCSRVAVSLKTLAEGFRPSGLGLQSFFLPPRIGNTLEYAARRRGAVSHELATGEHVPPEEQPLAHRPLELAEERPVTFLSFDICGATRMRAEDPGGFDRAFTMAFQELAATVNHFYGSIHRTTGDGFIAFVDHPSVTARDSAVDMGLSLLAVLRDTVNPALEEVGLRPLAARVGADHGPARMQVLRSPTTGFEQRDIVSDALNRAVKLQEAAAPGTMLIGEALREQLHVAWIERSEETAANLAEAVGIPGYRSFSVR
jgi:class 3 adenylate cyclase